MFNLLDNYGNPLSNRQVSIIIADKTYILQSDDDGCVSLKINLDIGTYTITIINPLNNESAFSCNRKREPT